MFKICGKCKEEKPIECFCRQAAKSKDGYKSHCKSCVHLYNMENREKIAQYKRQYADLHQDELKKLRSEHYENNKPSILEYQKKYAAQNKAVIVEYRREYYIRNKEKIKQKNMDYYKENSAAIIEHQSAYYRNNIEKVKEYKATYRKLNIEKLATKDREYREGNAEEVARRKALYCKNNRDKLVIYFKKYYDAHPDKKQLLSRRKYVSFFIRPDILKRDDYICQLCGIKSKKLEIHHIQSATKFPDLIENIDNLITLCRECHKNKAHSGNWQLLNEEIQSQLLDILHEKCPVG